MASRSCSSSLSLLFLGHPFPLPENLNVPACSRKNCSLEQLCCAYSPRAGLVRRVSLCVDRLIPRDSVSPTHGDRHPVQPLPSAVALYVLQYHSPGGQEMARPPYSRPQPEAAQTWIPPSHPGLRGSCPS